MIEVANLRKVYRGAEQPVEALRGLSFRIDRGECVAIMGPSGCGKSTLLHCLGGLDRATSGTVKVDGVNLGTLSDGALTRFRRDRLGFVFQFFNLLPTLTVRENVLLPCLLRGGPTKKEERLADELLAEVGMSKRQGHRPYQLSGGEMQRTALARALVTRPALVLADEPTGNLDSKTSGRVVELVCGLGVKHGTTVVIVTHSAEIAREAGRTIELRDGLQVEASRG